MPICGRVAAGDDKGALSAIAHFLHQGTNSNASLFQTAAEIPLRLLLHSFRFLPTQSRRPPLHNGSDSPDSSSTSSTSTHLAPLSVYLSNYLSFPVSIQIRPHKHGSSSRGKGESSMPGNITAADALNVGGHQHMSSLMIFCTGCSPNLAARFPSLAGVALLALPAHPSTAAFI